MCTCIFSMTINEDSKLRPLNVTTEINSFCICVHNLHNRTITLSFFVHTFLSTNKFNSTSNAFDAFANNMQRALTFPFA